MEGDLPEEIKNGVFTLSPEMYHNYAKLIQDIVEYDEAQLSGTDHPITGFELTCRYSTFIMQILRHGKQRKDRISHSTGSRTYRKIIELMQKEVLNNLSLEDISAKTFVSVSYIKKLFARYIGIGPKNYYTNLRVEEAKRLLNTDLSVAEISEMMNFSSPSYFVTFFKNNTGHTPAQYRKS